MADQQTDFRGSGTVYVTQARLGWWCWSCTCGRRGGDYDEAVCREKGLAHQNRHRRPLDEEAMTMDEAAVTAIREQHERECAFCHYSIGEFCEVEVLLAEVERLQVENQRLWRQREEAILRRIEAENPGVDIKAVARERAQRHTG